MFSWNSLSLPKFISGNARWLDKQQTSIMSAAVVITVANILSSLAGLVRERLLISSFFDTVLSQQSYEAFLVAFQIPDMMFQLLILGAVSAAFIPVFTKVRKGEGEEVAFNMTSTVMTILLLIFLLVGAVVAVFAQPLTELRTGAAFTPTQIKVAADLTRIMIIAQFFFAISNFFTGVLQSYHRFIIPAIAPVFYNIGIVAGVYFLSPMFGIYSAGIGVVIGALIHMLLQLPAVYRLGFRFAPSINLSQIGVKKIFSLMPPRVLTYSLTEIQSLSLTFFATSLGNLSFFTIKLGLKLMTLPIRLFGVSIGQASLPFLSAESDEKDRERFKVLLLQSINQITFLSLPASVLLLILRVPIIRLVFGARNLPWETTLAVGRVVAIIAVSIAAQAMVQLLIRAFHALKDTKTPFMITLAVVVFYLVGSAFIVFYTDMGILGLALITTLSALLEQFAYLTLLNKKIDNLFTSEFWVPQIKMVTAGFLMAVFLYLPFRVLDEVVFNTTRTIELLALTITTSTIGMLVYIYFAALLDIHELKMITKVLRHIDYRRKNLAKTQEVVVETSAEDHTM